MYRLTQIVLIFCICSDLVLTKSYHRVSKAPTDKYNNKDVEDAEDMSYWAALGRQEIESALLADQQRNFKVAKNIILFIGDGMGIPTLTAARIFKAQKIHNNFETSEKEYLTFERFPNLGLSKTYNIDHQVPESGSTASAMYSGIKTKHDSFGYDSHINIYNISSALTSNEVTTILSWAQDAGKHTGIVTTSRLTHATPAALYAHVFNRGWECDTVFGKLNVGATKPEGLNDIAWQLVNREPGSKTNVLMGGGVSAFYPVERMQEVKALYNASAEPWDSCFRNDSLNLADQWLSDHGSKARLVHSRQGLMDVNAEETDFLMGLFAQNHVEYDDLRTEDHPSISEMVGKAIEILRKNPSGFFLMVEGGRIDHAHHDSQGNRAVSETVAMDLAVEKAIQLMEEDGSLDETLFIVTADHSHTMSINGYAKRGSDIRGLSGETYHDDLPYTILSYANGPGYHIHNLVDPSNQTVVTRLNLSMLNPEAIKDFGFTQTSGAYKASETHGGDDVPIFAQGPMSHLIHRTHEQSYIAYVMAYSACLGPYAEEAQCNARTSAATDHSLSLVALFIVLYAMLFH